MYPVLYPRTDGYSEGRQGESPTLESPKAVRASNRGERKGKRNGEQAEEIHRGKEGGGVNTTTSGLQTTEQNWTRLMSPGEEWIFVLSG